MIECVMLTDIKGGGLAGAGGRGAVDQSVIIFKLN